MMCPECDQVMHMNSADGTCKCISCGYEASQSPLTYRDSHDILRMSNEELNSIPTFEDNLSRSYNESKKMGVVPPLKEKSDTSTNNGGETDYYKLTSAPFPITDADDFAEWRKMNFYQGNILKVVWTMNTGRHDGTNYVRDLNKIIHYAQRELRRLNRGESNESSTNK